MGLIDFFKRRKNLDADDTSGGVTSAQPSPETMFALNHSAAQIIKDGEYAKYGFESQTDLAAAFTIVEILGASDGKMSDSEIIEIIGAQFGTRLDRCEFLIMQAHKAGM
jgi:hypothetical protein